MKQILIYLALLTTHFVTMTYCGRCRYVTSIVCEDDFINPSEQGSEKGEVGPPGPSESQGINGSRHVSGDVSKTSSEKGSCPSKLFENDILRRFKNLENFVRFDSCTNSPIDGNQFLRNGLQVYCENRWSIFQRRFDGSVNFQRTWDEYKVGFGETEGEFWLGLEKVHRLTRGGNCNLRIELQNFDDVHYWAEYSSFSVDSEADLYKLHVAGHTGNATDGLFYPNQPFVTIHFPPRPNCATLDGNNGGWWYTSWDNCGDSWLNGLWGENGRVYWKGVTPRPKATTMKFRCD
ncbi:microfibril-associated glycoprotein 4-like [Clavelina lepadiformis]|uniref:microfibril-associated glycoprotein 4-like n=1 Tax=Clavelina lepadiformis TaxID=159417 RepID=UPI004042D502